MFLCIGDRLGRQVFGGEGGGSLRYGELREQEAQAQGHEAAREASSFFKVNRPLAVRPQQGVTGIPRERSRALKSIRSPFFSLIAEIDAEDRLGHGTSLLSVLQQPCGLGQQIQPPLQAGGVADHKQKVVVLV